MVGPIFGRSLKPHRAMNFDWGSFGGPRSFVGIHAHHCPPTIGKIHSHTRNQELPAPQFRWFLAVPFDISPKKGTLQNDARTDTTGHVCVCVWLLFWRDPFGLRCTAWRCSGGAESGPARPSTSPGISCCRARPDLRGAPFKFLLAPKTVQKGRLMAIGRFRRETQSHKTTKSKYTERP